MHPNAMRLHIGSGMANPGDIDVNLGTTLNARGCQISDIASDSGRHRRVRILEDVGNTHVVSVVRLVARSTIWDRT